MESLFVTVQETAKILNQGHTKIHNSLQQGKVLLVMQQKWKTSGVTQFQEQNYMIF